MRSIVEEAFPSWVAQFEGSLRFMYLDELGLVTTGIGNLIDPMSMALALPWKIDGVLATRLQIIDAWQVVKAKQEWKLRGGVIYGQLTRLRLDPADVDVLVHGKLMANEHDLAKRICVWEDLPADAQLAVHSMAWAMGDGFQFPRLIAALERGDFATAAHECRISNGASKRNAADRALFLACLEFRDEPELLHLDYVPPPEAA